jgi:hypothetical protein
VVDLRHPGIDFVASVGLLVDVKKSVEKEEASKEVDCWGRRPVTKTLCDGPDPDLDPKFKRGDDVTVIKRMTWTIPQLDAPKYRKDILEGIEGVIEGWVDIEQRQVLLTVITDRPSGANQSITKETYTKNLKLTKEYQESKGGHADPGKEQHSRSRAPSSAKADPCECLECALGESDASSVKTEPSFKTLHADCDMNIKLMYIRSRIGVTMEALAESLPSYSGKDFLVVHKKNNKGLWKDEL